MSSLKEFRNGLGLSKPKMAQALGVSPSMYEKVESGERWASRAFMESLKKAYPMVSIDDMFFSQYKNEEKTRHE